MRIVEPLLPQSSGAARRYQALRSSANNTHVASLSFDRHAQVGQTEKS
jgi:hypothetical protein